MKLFLLAALLPMPVTVQAQNSTDVAAIVQRATAYVTRYEEELGNLIGAEDYVQNSTRMAKTDLGQTRVVERLRRRVSSDFLIIQVGPEWSALRKVNRVDGLKVGEPEPSLEETFDDSPSANYRRLLKMKSDSTQYNIGDIIRDINLPTFALKVLRKNEVSRFAFERGGTSKVEGIQTVAIRFKEKAAPTLVSAINNMPLYSNGTIWIEPETGRVLRTEFLLENPYAAFRVRARIEVRYAEGKTVNMLVPTFMGEHYESAFNTVDCQAFYSNFRPFEVDVKFEIHPPGQ
jgi:hypothetical protein